MSRHSYAGFLGTWTLDPASCDYQQSEPPREANYRIEAEGSELRFTIRWVDQSGEEHLLSFSGAPSGEPFAFQGGELADSMAITLVSPRELNTSAFYQGRELMIAQRQLDESGSAMRVTQVVRFLDGTSLANVGVYRKNACA